MRFCDRVLLFPERRAATSMQIYDRGRQSMLDVTIESSASGNAKKIEMRSASPTHSQHFGTAALNLKRNTYFV
jgi:hypothetical protein